MIIDLVCKMEIDEEAASYSLNYDGKDYFFFFVFCMEEFTRRPLDYVESV